MATMATEYLNDHGIRDTLKTSCVKLLNEKPAQPESFLAKELSKVAEKKYGTTNTSSVQEVRQFMGTWDSYKAVANNAVGDAKATLDARVDENSDGINTEGEKFLDEYDTDKDGSITATEYSAMEGAMAEKWKAMVNSLLDQRALATGTTREAMEDKFVQKHLTGMARLGYKLPPDASRALDGLLRRFHVCDIGPAPFSVHSVEGLEGVNMDEVCVTVSNHCLQLATHWLRNPPELFEVLELEEFIVLSLFHDVYYYDDFTNHDIRPVDDLSPFLRYKRPAEVVGTHLGFSPDKEKLRKMKFDNELDALKQEWVQMDWFLGMVSMKAEGQAVKEMRPSDGMVLPLEFFYHIIGRVMSQDLGDMVIQKTRDDAEAKW